MGSANLTKAKRSSSLRIAIVIDTAIAITLLGLGLYHITHQGWVSGFSELLSAVLLLTAAYLMRQTKAAAINFAVAALVFVVSLYHLTHGGGWRSGTTELFFTCVLVIAARLVYQARTADRGV